MGLGHLTLVHHLFVEWFTHRCSFLCCDVTNSMLYTWLLHPCSLRFPADVLIHYKIRLSTILPLFVHRCSVQFVVPLTPLHTVHFVDIILHICSRITYGLPHSLLLWLSFVCLLPHTMQHPFPRPTPTAPHSNKTYLVYPLTYPTHIRTTCKFTYKIT